MEHSMYISNYLKEYAKCNGLTEREVMGKLKCSITNFTLFSVTRLPDMRLPGFYRELDEICRARECDFVAMTKIINDVMVGLNVAAGDSAARHYWRCTCGKLWVTPTSEAPGADCVRCPGSEIEEVTVSVFCKAANITAKLNNLLYEA